VRLRGGSDGLGGVAGRGLGSCAWPELAGSLEQGPGERVLDIACGQARLGADVVGVDISAAMLNKAGATGPEGIAYVRADVTRHPTW
jgi:ubiquinone/menaquinone biosynthesis C-methylase UbiE